MADEETTGDETEFNIAQRTRSHLKIDDYVLNDNMDFPDVEKDLYQNPDSTRDPLYKKFLDECYRDNFLRDDTNTDDNDPAYVYNDDVLSHGWRFDLEEGLIHSDTEDQSSKFSSFQQQSVSDAKLYTDDNHNQHQLKSANQQNLSVTCYDPHSIATGAISSSFSAPGTIGDGQLALLSNCPPPQGLSSVEFKSPMKSHRRRIDMFDDPEFARVLNQQLRQHIQLLTQAYLLTKNTTNMRHAADEAKSHLNAYMKVFKNKSKPSNLLPAMNLVNNLATPRDIKSSIRLSWRHLPVPESVKTIIKENPNVFIYPTLLPQVAFSFLPDKLAPKKLKINFTLNEDKLLAYALHEFKGEISQYAFIASLLMAAKTKTQISNHIKNIKRSPGNENNPIKLYFNQGILPSIDLDSDADLREINFDQYAITCSPREADECADNDDSGLIRSDNNNESSDLSKEVTKETLEITGSSFIEQEPAEDGSKQPEDNSKHSNQKEEQPVVELATPMEQPAAAHVAGQTAPFSPHEDQLASVHVETNCVAVVQSSDQQQPQQQLQQQQAIQNEEEPEDIGHNDGDEPKERPFEMHFQEHDDFMNMDLDDLMAASTTITKGPTTNTSAHHLINSTTTTNSCNENPGQLNNISESQRASKKLKKSTINLMANKLSLSQELGDMITYDFMRAAQATLSERDHLHLLQLFVDLMKRESINSNNNSSNNDKQSDDYDKVVTIYMEIKKFLNKIQAPEELHERLVLFLSLDQATKCGCAISYLHWMRVFEFIQNVELYHDDEAFEKKLARLIDALQREDLHKVKLASANLVNKDPNLKRQFESLALDGKPDPALFADEKDFDDITEPMNMLEEGEQQQQTMMMNHNPNEQVYHFEHFNSKVTKEELSYASQSCPCKCHGSQPRQPTTNGASSLTLAADPEVAMTSDSCPIIGEHCGKCNLKFIKGRMYLVNKIKPILAEWTYASSPPPLPNQTQMANYQLDSFGHQVGSSSPAIVRPLTSSTPIHGPQYTHSDPFLVPQATLSTSHHHQTARPRRPIEWTFEEDKEILEFCRAKAEQNDETVSFDTTTFEELVQLKRRRVSLDSGDLDSSNGLSATTSRHHHQHQQAFKKTAREIAERFNQLMEMYKVDENSDTVV